VNDVSKMHEWLIFRKQWV